MPTAGNVGANVGVPARRTVRATKERQDDEAPLNRMEKVAARAQQLAARAPKLSGAEDPTTRDLIEATASLYRSGLPSITPLLPLLLQLRGEPYTLRDHFPFEPYFRTQLPSRFMFKTARQVSKSTSVCTRNLIFSNSVPHFQTLFVTPLFEMIRRFSHEYMGKFVEESPMKRLFVGSKTVKSVLQRTFLNGSTMYFSYAFLDATRTRGVPADANICDEIQDFSIDLLPIIHATLGASPWKLIHYAGTPKSLENTCSVIWEDTSQAEWIIKCQTAGCNHWNVPALEYDLLDMIGEAHDDISRKNPGVVCSRCRKPLDPRRHGRWYHRHRERRLTFPGYHIPQIIMPMHYASPEAWYELVGRSQGKWSTTQTAFLNENCGEACDVGSKLLTLSDLKAAACLPWPNKLKEASRKIGGYRFRVLAIDWGGGGGRVNASRRDEDKRLRTSFTALAVLGLRADGKIDVIWGHRSLRTHDHLYEAALCAQMAARFKCTHIVHDYGGAGAVRETLLAQSGFPLERIIPIAYCPTARHALMTYHGPTEDHPRNWYAVDKARSLATTCEAIKYLLIRFFAYDHKGTEDPGLLHDFLALMDEKVDSRIATDVFTIVRNPNMPDDFAQAVNIGACALWYLSNRWPDLAAAAQFKLGPELLRHLHPQKADWDDVP